MNIFFKVFGSLQKDHVDSSFKCRLEIRLSEEKVFMLYFYYNFDEDYWINE
jgi:hypothetical protein